jgi:hypothetical protein
MKISISVRNVGGSSDDHVLRSADHADMIAGLHRTLSYIVLSMLEERVVDRTTRNSKVQVFSQAPSSGSVLHAMYIEIMAHPEVFLAGAASGVVGNYITRFIDFVVKYASGLLTNDDYEKRHKEFERHEPYFEDLVRKIEPHVAGIHAPIQGDEKIEININNSSQIDLDFTTKDYVSSSEVSEQPQEYSGYVSRLNLLTGNGRIYTREHNKVFSFSQGEDFRLSPNSEVLSWSLRQKDTNLPSNIIIHAYTVRSNSGRIKRLWLHRARRST